MAILNWSIDFPDQANDVGGAQCRLGKLACNDSLGAVVTPGYLNSIVNPNNVSQSGSPAQSYFPLPNDQWVISNPAWGSALFSSVNNGGILSLLQLTPVLASFALTAAQFNGMYAAPVEILAAQGAGNLILVNSMQLVLNYGSAAFASGGVVGAQYGSAADGAGPLATDTLAAADFFATANSVFLFKQASSAPLSSVGLNGALYLSNATQAFTTGTGSSFVGNIWYRVLNL